MTRKSEGHLCAAKDASTDAEWRAEGEVIHEFEKLYWEHLNQGGHATQQWQRFYDTRIISSPRRPKYEQLQQQLRSKFHADQSSQRRTQLASLLAQTPPFSFTLEDRRLGKTRQIRQKRSKQFQQFVIKYATRDAIGVRPFFASLKRILEYQGSGNVDRCCQWLLDDAVLMETGGEGWLESVVWIMKGVLLFTEQGSIPDDPFLNDTEHLRNWTSSEIISDPEYRRLARLVPLHVIPKRGRGSQPIHHLIKDEEALQGIDLPTGNLCLSDTLRDDDYKGGLLERLFAWLFAAW